MFKIWQKHKRLIVIITIIVVTILLILLLGGQRRFYRRSIRDIESSIRSLGTFSPFAVITLATISTLIPPLPLPVPLIEIASGLVFGFWYGFLLNWAAQIVSSLLAFYAARYFERRLLKRFTKYRFLLFYKDYLKKSGATAVFTTRALMASPFNVVSFLAGITSMNVFSFLVATILGTIPESAFYAFIGSLIKTTRFKLVYVFAFALIVAGIGLITTCVMIFRQHDLSKRDNT